MNTTSRIPAHNVIVADYVRVGNLWNICKWARWNGDESLRNLVKVGFDGFADID